MPEIRLHPSQKLILNCSEQELQNDSAFKSLQEKFQKDWPSGLFDLAASLKIDYSSLTVRFWQEIAATYLTRLCHIPQSETEINISPPSSAEYTSWVVSAPPMSGGEYLNEQVLAGIWHSLDSWVHKAIDKEASLESFINKSASGWNRVGRVSFHLAENPKDENKPFAFMATFTTGLGAGGKVKHVPLGKALQTYAGLENKQALVRLLAPVQAAAKKCSWVGKMVESKEIYRPLAWPADKAYQMLCSAETLEECGLSLRLPNWWAKRPKPQVSVTIGEQKKNTLSADALLDFDMQVALGGEELSEQEIEELLAGEEGLVWLKGQWVEVDREKLQQAVEHWQELKVQAEEEGISFIKGMRLLAGASGNLQDEEQIEELKPWVHIRAGNALQEILDGLREPGSLEAVQNARDIKADLRPYQQEGVSWLYFLTELGLGACLADDMGLGKTLQVLALLQGKKGNCLDAPALLVIPASLLGNWRNEAERFAPKLRLAFLHPSEIGKSGLEQIAREPESILSAYDLVVTSYSMVHRLTWLQDMRWSLIILDEAQAIKNPSTRQTKTVKKLSAKSRVALTGTPVENRLGDLWSLFDFLNPGLLGSSKVFKQFVQKLEEKRENPFAPLRRLVSPYILRRLKTDGNIIADLPDKTETVSYCTLSKIQIKYYTQIVQVMQEGLKESEDMARRGLVLQSIMRLKQVCNHPSQFSGDMDYNFQDSGKFARLGELCEELAQRQEKVLIFTQFKEIMPALEDYLTQIFGCPGLILHGSTQVPKRNNLVKQFQKEDGPPFFILSLKAGGTGLNLTSASQVIHFDRWWNPAVENQATDRAFRIGQKKNVLVHKFVTRGTIEERIDQLIQEKKDLAENVLSASGEVNLTELADDELMDLVRLDINRASG